MSTAKMLTDISVQQTRANPTKRREIADGGCRGLYLVVQPNGGKSWAVRYRYDGASRKLTLGSYPALTLAAARARAAGAIEQVEQGHDPAAAKRTSSRPKRPKPPPHCRWKRRLSNFSSSTTVDGAASDPRITKRETARLLGLKRNPETTEWIATGGGVLARWRRIKATSCHQARRDDLLDDLMKTPVSANRTLAVLKTCFKFHRKRDNLLISPAEDIDDPAPEGRGRERVLSDAELAALWRACEAERLYGLMTRLLI